MDWLIALVTLSAMEIVLGIDNIIFISILCGKLPVALRPRARSIGLLAALGTRILLLLSLSVVLQLTSPVFFLSDLGVPEAVIKALDPHPKSAGHAGNGAHADVPQQETTPGADETADPSHEHDAQLAVEKPAGKFGDDEINEIDAVSWKDIILLLGGLFLIGKSVIEIHHKLDEVGHHEQASAPTASFVSVISQIAVLDVIFSLDSVITAVGMADQIWVMVTAVVIAIGVMLVFAGAISEFVDRHPTIKVLALSFLILIGVMLVAEGIGTHFNKGYIYFAMAFSLVVEMLNMKLRAHTILPTKSVAAADASTAH
ncbi:MAG: TerC family protein [Planctomycetaceae bacterium]|nr:TerC family protein [Planctomycetaceae bacterium]